MSSPLRLSICPTESSYATEHNTDGYLRVDLDGGMGRYRKDILNPSTIVNCRWVVNKTIFDYLWAFYRTYLRNMEPFYIDLVLEERGRVRVLANIIPDSWKFGEKRGPTYTITANLEVQAPQYDALDDLIYIILINEFGENYAALINLLHQILHVEAPGVTILPADL